jgi:UDP-N-acetylglucosamine 2-epimerase
MHILHVAGARPNFVKAAPVMRALERWPGDRQMLVQTGQHYDRNLSDIFLSQLNKPAPDENLEVGSGSHALQTAEVMNRFEPVALERKPEIVLVYDDVDSTVAQPLNARNYLSQLVMWRLDFVPSIALCRKRSTGSWPTNLLSCRLISRKRIRANLESVMPTPQLTKSYISIT